MQKPKGRVLIIAGSDSGGGAGIQADIKAATCLGAYAATAITALTAQNTLGVQGIAEVETGFIRQQIISVLSDIGADVIKTGMLHSEAVINVVVDTLAEHAPDIPLIVDPVMVAKGGAALLQQQATHALTTRLLPRAALITPNIPEAEALSGMTIKTIDDMEAACEKMLTAGPKAILLKGGHMDSGVITDMLCNKDGVVRFSHKRIETAHTHGTGCTLASSIAALLARGYSLTDAVIKAREYVLSAMEYAPGFGSGHGPLGHNFAFSD